VDETNDPFVERPDEHEETGEELYCWIPGGGDRQCGPDCVAYDLTYEEDQRRTSCQALNAFRALSVGVNIIGKAATSKQREAKARAVSEKISEIPGPPEVK
jgi:hypothetical protein